MSEKNINKETIHHETDEMELSRLETNLDERDEEIVKSDAAKPRKMFAWIVTAAIIGLILLSVSLGWQPENPPHDPRGREREQPGQSGGGRRVRSRRRRAVQIGRAHV